MHARLHTAPPQTTDPLSSFLNQLPQSKPTPVRRIQQLQTAWLVVCIILAELDAHQLPGPQLDQSSTCSKLGKQPYSFYYMSTLNPTTYSQATSP
ncbi:hypothetical protein BDB00DRAFT_823336 [Zychaea mexicana]|uniref:uncharacterized protein n=1 Tax=Zychaea mexicana TaxID=64656 RepID=UPI0022FDCF73|nr:uncharacterized protein BDB00DRAFT_823336 [Zychaea mexicana]KAI9493503.1 hypothetical protein BDB00DRAFT_823336 [Zychaea mexicana]